VVANNEFGIKYRVLHQEPATPFLLYHPGPEPAENWLMDLKLAGGLFKADQVTLWLAELGLEAQFAPVVQDHAEFFRQRGRVDALLRRRQGTDTPSQMRLRMAAICVGAQGGLDTVVEALLADLAAGRDTGLRLLDRCGLTGFLWKQVAAYGYISDTPDIEDFAITLFKACHRAVLGEASVLTPEALVLFRRWKNDRVGAESFAVLSGCYAEVLQIKADVAARDLVTLVEADTFEEIDREIIRKLVSGMAAQTLSAAEVLKYVRQRRESHWYAAYADIYQALGYATEFQQALGEATLGMTSLAEGFHRYATSWFKLDQLYRKFIYHLQRSAQAGLLGPLFDRVENLYVNTYLLRLNDAWAEQVARADGWQIPGVARQMDFWREQTGKYRDKGQKFCVIISDAMRFEVAEELLSRIRGLDKFDAELKPMLGVLPSYTQLGMAALLPHQALRIAEDGTGTVFDGAQSTQGQAGREKVLAAGSGQRVAARGMAEVMALRGDEAKEFFRDHDVIYVYHNRIDMVGDKLATEDGLADAAEVAMEELVQLVKKLTSANASNILITADHGFLYQHRLPEESDFSIAEVEGDTLYKNRRFVLGMDLPQTAGMRHFTPAQLGLGGAVEVLIPNSINRLRRQGAGSRFMHGGASLQEIVVPVLQVGKGRDSDVRQVGVQVLASGRRQITSGQMVVTFYQVEPVTDKVQARHLRVGIYAADGTLISDSHDMTFDFKADQAREREQPRKFLMSRQADAYNNQDVFLRLEERVGKTTHFQDYDQVSFQLRRGMATDFEF
jgi:uncharacterized protein (TIGR02687 family)